MNRQPYQTPPRYWPPQLTPFLVRSVRHLRLRTLHHKQRMRPIDVQGMDILRSAFADNAGVLITPNHSFHYDAHVLFETAHRVGRPFHFLTAWQVFAMSTWMERWWLQKHGCFSIDRESNDLQAMRQSITILRESPYPLVIFPEGDIYHTNDRITPFREGAAAIALSAAKKSQRPIVCVPCALKCWYTKNPMPELLTLMDQLEQRLHWRPQPDRPLAERVYRLAEGMLSLKELEYLGTCRSGTIPQRRDFLANAVLETQEAYYQLRDQSHLRIPERVKELRRTLIPKLEQMEITPKERERAQSDMEDLFFVIQLYSYPGDYVREKMSIERLAETLDKFEEDLLRHPLPSVRGSRRVVVRFGEPVRLEPGRQKRGATVELTQTLHGRVQAMIDALNAEAVNTL